MLYLCCNRHPSLLRIITVWSVQSWKWMFLILFKCVGCQLRYRRTKERGQEGDKECYPVSPHWSTFNDIIDFRAVSPPLQLLKDYAEGKCHYLIKYLGESAKTTFKIIDFSIFHALSWPIHRSSFKTKIKNTGSELFGI